MSKIHRQLIENHWPLNGFAFKDSSRNNLQTDHIPYLLCLVKQNGQPPITTSVVLTNLSWGLVHMIDLHDRLNLTLGGRYEMKLALPHGSLWLQFSVTYRKANRFGAKLIDSSEKAKRRIGQLLLNTNPSTPPKKVYETGFKINSINEAINISFVTESIRIVSTPAGRNNCIPASILRIGWMLQTKGISKTVRLLTWYLSVRDWLSEERVSVR